jgi:hypothetical protein
MDADQTLKILKMVQEGFLTPEQGQRLIQELIEGGSQSPSGSSQDARPMPPPSSDSPDLFRLVEEAGKTFTKGFEQIFGFATQTVKEGFGLGPQNVILKVLDAEGTVERYSVTIPYKIFTALKPLLVQKPPMVVHPIQNIDYQALYESLESGQTGRVFEYVDHTRGDRLEVWVQ